MYACLCVSVLSSVYSRYKIQQKFEIHMHRIKVCLEIRSTIQKKEHKFLSLSSAWRLNTALDSHAVPAQLA